MFEQHIREIDGVKLTPWNHTTAKYCEGTTSHPADDLTLCVKVFGMLGIVQDNGSTLLLTTADRRYAALTRKYWLQFGVNLGVSMSKSYVPWFVGRPVNRPAERPGRPYARRAV